MNWKTLATLLLALVAGVVASVFPEASTIASAVSGFCLGAVLPAAKTWGQPQAPSSGSTPTVLLGFILGAAVLLSAGQVRAADRQFGGCIVQRKVAETACLLEAGPSVAVTVGKYSDGKFSAGLLPGIGYGLTLFPGEWYAVGLAGYGQLEVGGGQNTAALSGLLSFANYVRFGLGSTWTEQPTGPAFRSTAWLMGLGSPRYVRAAAGDLR
jgi:hypothetical protein